LGEVIDILGELCNIYQENYVKYVSWKNCVIYIGRSMLSILREVCYLYWEKYVIYIGRSMLSILVEVCYLYWEKYVIYILVIFNV